MRSIEVIVIGGGAAGMMAAITAKREGARVLILEKKNRVGKKILATGNGKCNFTNKFQEDKCYRSSSLEFPLKVIRHFDEKQVIKWFQEIGILAKEKSGYIYPASNQAASVLHALEREINRLKIEVHTEENVEQISNCTLKNRDGYQVITDGDKYFASKIILTTGGKASPVHGSSGDGFRFAKELGHTIIRTLPALTSVILEESFTKIWSGIRVQGKVSLYSQDNKLLTQDSGEIQLVAYGISGIPIFQISHFVANEKAAGRNVVIHLDSMPDYESEWIVQELLRRQSRDDKQSMGDLLEGMLPDKFIKVILQKSKLAVSDLCSVCDLRMIQRITRNIKDLELSVKNVSDFEKAQVTSGGVSLAEVDLVSMESKKRKGLYFAGEILDVDGICGGYNLQWAWTTGCLAGKAAGKKKSGNGD